MKEPQQATCRKCGIGLTTANAGEDTGDGGMKLVDEICDPCKEQEEEEPVIVYENEDGKCQHPLSAGDNNGECGEPIAIVYPDGTEGSAEDAKKALTCLGCEH